MSKRGQITIFIILAIVIVAGIFAYSYFSGDFPKRIPLEFRPVYDYYLSCLEDSSREGINLLGEQGGYIGVPEFESGSSYSPTSSQLSFFGQPVPYWIYLSGNNLLKEQVPTKNEMEIQLAGYVEERVDFCDFTDFELTGFDVYIDDGAASAKINDLDVDLKINNKITVFKGNSSIVVDNHKIKIRSKLGKFYGLAREVYEFEKSNTFLENYALDVMRLYAPVDGIEISCAPKLFIKDEIREDITEGLVANIASLKLNGEYYDLSSKERNYFVTDIGIDVDENINFMYFSDWPTRIEIYGDEVASPVGIQEGLSALGFCYVPYHFVYDINFPVLIQFYDNEEIFQFPISVIIDKSQARQSLPTIFGTSIESKVCEFKNQEVEIKTYDVDLNPVEAQISFKCLDAVCQIGETSRVGEVSILNAGIPQCVNGFIIARAEGFNEIKYQISTNEIDFANIILDKKYGLDLDLGEVKQAIINFNSKDYSRTVLYPETDSIELIEGYYNISVVVYDNSSLVFPEIKERKCVDVPDKGLSGFFGGQTEKCFDYLLPETRIDYAVVGGGKTSEYLTVFQLEDSEEININVPLFGLPESLEDLQANSLAAEDELIYLEFE